MFEWMLSYKALKVVSNYETFYSGVILSIRESAQCSWLYIKGMH